MVTARPFDAKMYPNTTLVATMLGLNPDCEPVGDPEEESATIVGFIYALGDRGDPSVGIDPSCGSPICKSWDELEAYCSDHLAEYQAYAEDTTLPCFWESYSGRGNVLMIGFDDPVHAEKMRQHVASLGYTSSEISTEQFVARNRVPVDVNTYWEGTPTFDEFVKNKLNEKARTADEIDFIVAPGEPSIGMRLEQAFHAEDYRKAFESMEKQVGYQQAWEVIRDNFNLKLWAWTQLDPQHLERAITLLNEARLAQRQSYWDKTGETK
jgi:hypothetical protein